MTAPRSAVLALLALFLAACATRGPIVGKPPIPPGVPAEYLHFTDATVGVGDVAPDFTLPSIDGFADVALTELRGKPLVLIFGSHT